MLLSGEIGYCRAFQVKGLGTAISLNALSASHILQVKGQAKKSPDLPCDQQEKDKQASRMPTAAFPKIAPVSLPLHRRQTKRAGRNHRILHAARARCSHESLPRSMFPIQCPIRAFTGTVCMTGGHLGDPRRKWACS